jgi:hypothetical protein
LFIWLLIAVTVVAILAATVGRDDYSLPSIGAIVAILGFAVAGAVAFRFHTVLGMAVVIAGMVLIVDWSSDFDPAALRTVGIAVVAGLAAFFIQRRRRSGSKAP